MTVKDSLGGNISAANVYLYTSEVLAVGDDSNAAIESFFTDNSGQIKKDNLQPNVYFLNAKKTVNNVVYQRLAKRVVVPSSGILSDTLIVTRRQ